MPDPGALSIGEWIICFVAVVVAVNQVMAIVDRIKSKPAPNDSKEAQTINVAMPDGIITGVKLDDTLSHYVMREHLAHARAKDARETSDKFQTAYARINDVENALTKLQSTANKS